MTGLRPLLLRPFWHGLRSPFFAVCVLAGFVGLCFPGRSFPHSLEGLSWFVIAPIIEELTWRCLLQNELSLWLKGKYAAVLANLISSCAFALTHFAFAPNIMSLLTFFPSLVFGMCWARFHSLWLCALLHLWYNTALYL